MKYRLIGSRGATFLLRDINVLSYDERRWAKRISHRSNSRIDAYNNASRVKIRSTNSDSAVTGMSDNNSIASYLSVIRWSFQYRQVGDRHRGSRGEKRERPREKESRSREKSRNVGQGVPLIWQPLFDSPTRIPLFVPVHSFADLSLRSNSSANVGTTHDAI